jgi:hypothetical protein
VGTVQGGDARVEGRLGWGRLGWGRPGAILKSRPHPPPWRPHHSAWL